MAEEEVTRERGRWGTAIALTVAVVLLSVFDALALIFLPLAILLIGLPRGRSAKWLLVGGCLWVAGFLLSAGAFPLLSRGWGLVLGAAFLLFTVAKPGWGVTSRALASAAIAVLGGTVVLLASGRAGRFDEMVRGHFRAAAASFLEFQNRLPEAARFADPAAATQQIAELQADLFPAVLGLESVAALALVAWWVRRLGRAEDEAFDLSPMRDFRFSDQLIWVFIAALVGVLLPFGEGGSRAALNALVFMAALYVLRGLAIFLFLASGSRSVATIVLGALAFVLFYPVAFTAALLMGVGDTWLDIRRRAMNPTPT